MRRVVHLSDLHFGKARPELLGPLLEVIGGLKPHLVVVSGDLTQRARRSQFRDARAFLDRLPAPWISVPGNHDVPLYNLPMRMLHPYRNYRRIISRQLEPEFHDAELAVVAVNTTDPNAHQRGRTTKRAIARACRRLGPEDGRMRLVVVHHPFLHLPGEPKAPMKGAEAGIEALSAAGVDVVFSGHLHTWRVEPVATRIAGARTLQVQAGTGLSSRLRGEENDFNLLTLEPGRVTIERYAAEAGGRGFVHATTRDYVRTSGSWSRVKEEVQPGRARRKA